MKKVFVVLLLVVLYAGWAKTRPQEDRETFKPEKVAGSGEVILYATAWCGYCKKTRSFLEAKGIDYTEFDIEKSAEGARAYRKLNVRGVPILVVNGTLVEGYDPEGILEAYQAKK